MLGPRGDVKNNKILEFRLICKKFNNLLPKLIPRPPPGSCRATVECGVVMYINIYAGTKNFSPARFIKANICYSCFKLDLVRTFENTVCNACNSHWCYIS